MWFRPVIDRWGVVLLAQDLGLPAKNVRRWVDLDSIPADWFMAVARAASKRPDPQFQEITVRLLAEIAERRRLGVETTAQEAA